MSKLLLLVALTATAFSLFTVQANNHKNRLTVVVYDYPPDIVNSATNPEGPFIEKLQSITNAADLQIDWLRTNMSMESTMLDQGDRPFCTTGRAYSNERAKKWRFIPYLFSSLSTEFIIARKENLSTLQKLGSIRALTANQNFIGAFVKGGYYVDGTQKTLNMQQTWLQDIALSEEHALRLVTAGRADYTILPSATWKAMRSQSEQFSVLSSIHFAAKNESPVLLTCSKALPEKIFLKLSGAMAKLGFEKFEP